jgi:hypothetical protein
LGGLPRMFTLQKHWHGPNYPWAHLSDTLTRILSDVLHRAAQSDQPGIQCCGVVERRTQHCHDHSSHRSSCSGTKGSSWFGHSLGNTATLRAKHHLPTQKQRRFLHLRSALKETDEDPTPAGLIQRKLYSSPSISDHPSNLPP